MTAHHELMGGKLHVYKRENSRHWQCSTYLAGRNRRVSTKEESLQHAKDFAEDWFLELKGKARIGELKSAKGGKTFEFAADQFMREFEALTDGERSPIYVEGHRNRLRVHLKPFFGKAPLAEITPGLVQEYRIHRMTSRKHPKTGEPMRPARNTLHQEIVCLRQVLKTANRHGWLPYLPNLAAPFRASGKISHRGWFSPTEYKQLYEAARRRAAHPPKKRWKWSCEQLRDYVLFMANTGLRPDESARLEFRDVEIVDDDATGERILEIEVRGKRGVGFCKSMPGAVRPFERLRERLRAKDETGHAEGRRSVAADVLDGAANPKRKPIERSKPRPNDRLFPQTHRELFNLILEEEELKEDRDGQRRTAYSLRHTYICMRLMEGADIYQIAKNCRTSVEMIEKYYASHLKNTLDAAAINVRKPRSDKRKFSKKADLEED
jgi:integrase